MAPAKGSNGRFLGTATDARRMAKDLSEGKPVTPPRQTKRPLIEFEKEYAASVRLLALYKIEQRLLKSKGLEAKELVSLLSAVREHEEWARDRAGRPREGKRPAIGSKSRKKPPPGGFGKLDEFRREQA